MRLRIVLLATAFMPGAVQARMEKPDIGPAPAWVKPVALPAKPDKSDDAAVHVLLSDQQTKLEPGRVTTYLDFALAIQTSQGLQAGNLSFPWNPDTEEITVHKIVIHRDGKDIDMLAGGQTFTVVRREPNLEIATLDGVLTANIQPEGLQVGDVLEYAVTVSSADPVLKAHVEVTGAGWNVVPFTHAHLSVQWPSSLPVTIRQSGALPPVKPVKAGGTTSVELSLDNVQPTLPPRLAPARYALGRAIEFSDFRNWADLGALLAPLYAKAGTVPAQGPLRDEVEKIKAATSDPVKRAEAALALVQDRVRYVALVMGAGGLTPANAEETWSRRYGDCKAKSALLLALLRELGVSAEPVAANAVSGDGIDQRLPMVGLFNHVLVRAHIGGATYWLDGTRSGDTSLARLRVPDFSWGLPLVAKDAALVKMQPAMLDVPDSDMAIEIDARQGLTEPAPIKATMMLRGDEALGTKLALGQFTEVQRDDALRKYWKGEVSDVEVAKATAHYDPDTGEEILAMEGKAKMDWSDGQYWTDWTRVGYEADFSRTDSSDVSAPFVVDYPSYSRAVETIELPPGFSEQNIFRKDPIDETVGGLEYHRNASLKDNVFHIERSARAIMPELPATDAPAAQKRLKELYNLPVSLRKPANYAMTSAELDATLKETPTTVPALIDRGNLLLNQNKYADALVDFSDALAKEPKNKIALADRALAYVYMNQYDKATADLDAAQAVDPNYEVMWHGRGVLAERNGDYVKAGEAYGKAIKAKADDQWALGRRAYMRRTTGDFDGALSDAARALAENPASMDLHRLRADIFRIEADPKSALAEADAIAGPDERSVPALMQAGGIYETLDMNDKAVSAYDRVIAISPSMDAYLARARARDKTDAAGKLADLDAAAKLAPDDPRIVLFRGEMLFEAGDYAGAAKVYDAALMKQPKQPVFLLRRAIAQARAGDDAGASKDFAAAREAVSGAFWLNDICWEKGTAGVALQSALADCDAALAAEPNSAPVTDSRALVLLRLGRLDDAIAAYDKVIAETPRQATSLFGRALAWQRKGNSEKAQTDRVAALRIDPDIEKRFAQFGLTL